MLLPGKVDPLFKLLCLLCALIVAGLLLGFVLQLGISSMPVWRNYGLGFLWSREWNPVADEYGALPSIAGTLLTTALALLLALPLAFVSALFIIDAPPLLSRGLSQAIDLLAAIPSVIYGMWGLFVLCPLLQDHVQPFLLETLRLGRVPGLRQVIGEDYNGFGFFTAGMILALMILPYISAIMRDVFRMTPPMLRESAYGIGCTRWETARDIMLRYGIRGLLGGIFIGLGRALGETMAVLFVIGNMMEMPASLFSSGTTISATLANNFSEADGMQRSALFALGLVLLALSLGIQVIAHYYLNATRKKRGEGEG